VPDLPGADELERIAVRVAQLGAAIVAEGVGHAVQLRSKSSSTDIVTDIDIASEDAIRRALAAATPECGIVGEEGGGTNPTARLQWIVDPLDGTVNFAFGVPIFSVSIAAGVDGNVVAGAVADATRDDVYSARRAGGARHNGQVITASGCDDLAQALVATGFSYHPHTRREQGEVIGEVLPAARDIRCLGSAALNLCWVASGRFDAYFERDTRLWDYAAGALIAEEAGAAVELPCPENHGLTMAAATGVFEQLRAIVELKRSAPSHG
jgi:myo-inositol-1(or 4)-monophosphatase